MSALCVEFVELNEIALQVVDSDDPDWDLRERVGKMLVFAQDTETPAAVAVREALEAGLVPPDVLVGASLFLLASQPRSASPDGSPSKGAVAGGVWVREQVTFHHPVATTQELELSGESAQRSPPPDL